MEFNPECIPEFNPEIIDVTTLGDSVRHVISSPYTITTTDPLTTDSTIYYPPLSPSITAEDWKNVLSWKELVTKLGKKEEAEVNLVSKKSFDKHTHIVCCTDLLDLSHDKILITLSAIKGKLMFEVAPYMIKEFRCKMTPSVKKHIVEASRKSKMYGKKSPIIPSFDEYGNRLPDNIEIGEHKGIQLEIIDPDEYGEMYLELSATEFPVTESETRYDWISKPDYRTYF